MCLKVEQERRRRLTRELRSARSDLIERKIFRRRLMFAPPCFKQASVAQRHVLRVRDPQRRSDPVDPLRAPLQLGKIPDRSFIHHAMPFAVAPLAAPLLIPESRNQAQRPKHSRQCITVGDFRLGFHAMLVCILTRPDIGEPFVGQRPLARIVADAQNLCPPSHLPVRRVVKHIALERAWGLLAKTCRVKPPLQFRNISNPEFNLRLDRHVKQRVYEVAAVASNGENRRVNTLRLAVDPSRLHADESQAAIARAAEILRGGGLVALPTETVYGLGANALDATAVARIFAAKQRPAWDPIIVHIAGSALHNAMLEPLLTDLPPIAQKLMHAFWPGPLTLLLPRSKAVPDIVTAGRPLVGVRMPAHSVAFEVIRRAGVPVAAPSANVFGRISPTTAAHVLEDLDGKIEAVVDAGPSRHGVESTVLDPNQSPMVIYRPGAITAQQIRNIAGSVELFKEPASQKSAPESLPSPGVGLRHYAPRARLVLVEGALADLPERLATAAQQQTASRLGLMLPTELSDVVSAPQFKDTLVYAWGRWSAPNELAERLYAGLRSLDAKGCDVILCPVPGDLGIGEAIRDRLRKAATAARPDDR